MIKGLTGGPGVIVDGGSTALPWTNQNPSDSFGGVLRISGGDIQYYNSGAWNSLASSYATVRLDASVEAVLNWARDKMAFEASEKAARAYMERRALEFPGLQKALEAVHRAEDAQGEAIRDAIANFHILDKIAGKADDDGDMRPQSSP